MGCVNMQLGGQEDGVAVRRSTAEDISGVSQDLLEVPVLMLGGLCSIISRCSLGTTKSRSRSNLLILNNIMKIIVLISWRQEPRRAFSQSPEK